MLSIPRLNCFEKSNSYLKWRKQKFILGFLIQVIFETLESSQNVGAEKGAGPPPAYAVVCTLTHVESSNIY